MLKLITILLCAAVILNAQVEQSGTKNGALSNSFDIDLASYPTGQTGKTRLDVFIKVPYSNIQFVRTNEGFTGKYSITLTFYDEYQRGVVLERFWNEKIVAKEFSEAISNKNFNYGYRSFEFKPGKYYLRCELLDTDSRKSSIFQGFVNVAEYDSKVQLSDLIFISGKIQGAAVLVND